MFLLQQVHAAEELLEDSGQAVGWVKEVQALCRKGRCYRQAQSSDDTASVEEAADSLIPAPRDPVGPNRFSPLAEEAGEDRAAAHEGEVPVGGEEAAADGGTAESEGAAADHDEVLMRTQLKMLRQLLRVGVQRLRGGQQQPREKQLQMIAQLEVVTQLRVRVQQLGGGSSS